MVNTFEGALKREEIERGRTERGIIRKACMLTKLVAMLFARTNRSYQCLTYFPI